MPDRYAIALGSNRRTRHGSPAATLEAAFVALAAAGAEVVDRSAVIATPALGPAGRGFANAAAIILIDRPPPALLALLKRIERDFGRRPGRRWGARSLDLDILLWNGGHWPPRPRRAAPGGLAVPHTEIARRRFVLDPLLAIAAGWRDPRSGHTIRQLRARFQAGQ
ncbi:2-amino-4-hydroxy-6-hydroxymethyldihydropteridine diphosphokinase [Sphingomonas sp. 1P06PA]|uniref:2-amino-4-hydroxy-6- hydroxymethyldihydropteridine diphosphokinase n=1 Tax=Sphingomonas sp. 1P06PA TaxID=554121 RepID=UPI0039A62098